MQKGFIGKKVSARKRAKYQQWIDENVSDECMGDCARKSEAMAAQFPELRVVGTAAWYFQHAWCVDRKERVVDPTAHQFDGPFEYPGKEERLEKEDFPTSKCPECGDLTWPKTEGAKKYCELTDQTFDHTACYEAFGRVMNLDIILF